MYLQHFQLHRQPFSEHTAVNDLWIDNRMEEGLARLRHLMEHGVLGLVTGPSGVGKSALLKRFLHSINGQQYHTVYCHLTRLSAFGLLKQIVDQLGPEPQFAKEQLFQQMLRYPQSVERTLLLILDEAQLLLSEALTDLRLLISSALDQTSSLKSLLCGQDVFRVTLKRAQHLDLLNRVSVRFQIRALTKEQTARYIDFQISQAGGDLQLFTDPAKELIHDFTGGIPRHINNLPTACLLQAAAENLARVDEQIFRQAITEFQAT